MTDTSQQDVMTRLDRLEATVNRILRLQRLDIDDFTLNEANFAWSTQSNNCSAKSYGCTIGKAVTS